MKSSPGMKESKGFFWDADLRGLTRIRADFFHKRVSLYPRPSALIRVQKLFPGQHTTAPEF